MKKLSLCLAASLLIAQQAMAQATTPNTPEPAASIPNGQAPQTNFAPVVAPAAPVYPTVQPLTMAPAGVTSSPAVPASTTLQTNTAPAPAPTPLPIDLNAAIGKLSTNSNSQQKLGQVMVIGSIMSCTQKTAGKDATDAFYQQMQTVSKTIEADCKAGKPSDARKLALDTVTAKHNDPVVKAMLSCYDNQSSMVANLGGAQVAADAAHYSRWLRNPDTAKAEMQESDVCRNSKK